MKNRADANTWPIRDYIGCHGSIGRAGIESSLLPGMHAEAHGYALFVDPPTPGLLDGGIGVCYVSARDNLRVTGAVASKISGAAASSEVIFETTIRPNRSMSPRRLAVFVICFAVLSLTIALSFFSVGLWLVLPFAGLEILVVGAAIGYSIQRSQGYELIVVTERDVCVTQRQFGRSRRYEFQRYWTQVKLETGPSRLQPGRVSIGSHGRFVEIGRDLIDEDRENFAARLTEAIRGERKRDYNNLSEA